MFRTTVLSDCFGNLKGTEPTRRLFVGRNGSVLQVFGKPPALCVVAGSTSQSLRRFVILRLGLWQFMVKVLGLRPIKV